MNNEEENQEIEPEEGFDDQPPEDELLDLDEDGIDNFAEDIAEDDLEADSSVDEEDEEEPRPRARKVKSSDEDDDEEEEDEEDLEADLDAILKDRLATEDSDEDEDDDEAVVKSTLTPGEGFPCHSCFLTVIRSQVLKKDPSCPHCGEALDDMLISS